MNFAAFSSLCFGLVVDALRYNKDINEPEKLHKVIDDLLRERELAIKSGILTRNVKDAEQST